MFAPPAPPTRRDTGGALPRRVALYVVLAALAAGLFPSRPAAGQKLRIGVRAGPTFGFLNDNAVPFVSEPNVTTAHTNVRLDVHAGLHATLPIFRRFALQPELLFVQKGGHLSRTAPGLYTSERYRLSYLQGHLLVRHPIGLPGPLSMHAAVGPTLDLATGGAMTRDTRSEDFNVDQHIDLLKNGLIRRWDVGLLLGVGLQYPVGRKSTVALGLRYNPGFRLIFTETQRPAAERKGYVSDPPPLSDDPPPLRHDVIMASLSFTMPFRL